MSGPDTMIAISVRVYRETSNGVSKPKESKVCIAEREQPPAYIKDVSVADADRMEGRVGWHGMAWAAPVSHPGSSRPHIHASIPVSCCRPMRSLLLTMIQSPCEGTSID